MTEVAATSSGAVERADLPPLAAPLTDTPPGDVLEARNTAPSSAGPDDARKALVERLRAGKLRRKKEREARRQRGAKATPTAERDEPAPDPRVALPVRTADDRTRDAAVFVRAVWLVLGLLAKLFRADLDPLTDAEVAQTAPSWEPIARRHAAFDKLITSISAPVHLVVLVSRKLRRRAAPAASAPTPPAVVSLGDRRVTS